MNKLLRILQICFVTGILVDSFVARACRWDADTLRNEKKKKPEIAEIIFGTGKEIVDTPRLQKRISELKVNPRHDDPDWWNDFAGAYIQLGQPDKAVDLLEPVLQQFKDNYGIHANLGTAYHLLGRYQDAEKEIARDLEINPDAHFGLEKYHLALLQYLSRDEQYQKQHVYVDEWTDEFFKSRVEMFSRSKMIVEMSREDGKNEITNSFPPYLLKWNLAGDAKFDEGIRYMASLNPKQPACFTMLGIACAIHRDFNLASAAFEKAIALSSPQKEILQIKVTEAKEFISKSPRNAFRGFLFASLAAILFLIALRIIWKRFSQPSRQFPS